MTDSAHTDVAVIGAGPIGLELAVALKRAKIDYLQFDARQIAYTISWFAPGTRFFSSNERIAIAGVPLQTPDQAKCTREQYLAYLRSVAIQFDLRVNTYEPIVGIKRDRGPNGCFVLTTRPAGGDRIYRANRLVLCTGGTDRPRRLAIPGEDLPHVSHYFDDPHKYFRKRLLIVGGKNSAVEAALRLHAAGAEVSLSYRRAQLNARSIKYWLMPEISGLIESGKITAWFGTLPTAITPTSVRLARGASGENGGCRATLPPVPSPAVLLSSAGGGTGGTQLCPASEASPSALDLPFDFVLSLIGYEQDNALFKLAGVELDAECGAPWFNPATMETNVPGLYVAGTAVGGTQEKYTVFIENCHVHVDRIIAALTGAPPPEAPAPVGQPES